MNYSAKPIRRIVIAAVLLVSFTAVNAQRGTNVQKLQELSERFKTKWEQDNREANNFANRNGIPFRFQTDDGTLFEMQSVKDGIPMYYMTENANSAATISTNKLHSGGSSGLNLDGEGITIHEWDGGAVRASHQEYIGRVVMGDGVSTTHYHSTHVAGTLIASGVVSSAKGMAPKAELRAFDWNNDESEMSTEAAAGALVSNHSYGYGRGWVWTGSTWSWYGNTGISSQEDYLFGFYDSQAQEWDQIAYDAPYYLIVKSAGNDRGDGPSNPPYPLDGPYDCISHAGLGKNVLTVGAVNDITAGYSQPSDVVQSSFSSWGPVDDGRIKPDIVTNGVGLYSSDDGNDSDYTSLSGTSMAAPSATGSLALLQEHYENLNGAGNFMLAATLKALVIATADEAGPYLGPDYSNGWGLMNTENAALKISEDQNLNVIDELVLANGTSYTRSIYSDGSEPLKVTICWTDIPGTPVSSALDPSDIMLVNDLDIRITHEGSTYYPWKLDKDNPGNMATNVSENNVDNVEVVFIETPSAGYYTVTVDHDGTLSGGSQDFSIILDGISEEEAGGLNVYYGHLHNHSNVSDGTGTPNDAYNYAKNTAGLDFFGLSDHAGAIDANEWTSIKTAADNYNEDGVFTSFWGFEWSHSTHGHVTIINTPDYCNASSVPTFADLLTWTSSRDCAAFFNHPGRQDNGAEFGHFADQPSDKFVGMELWNKNDIYNIYYYNDGYYTGDNNLGYFDEALIRGWKIGAGGSEDNHDGNWGNMNDYHMAVLSPELTRTALYEAIQNKRFFSTLDKNIKMSFSINGNEMGSTIQGASGQDLQIQVSDDDGEDFTQIDLLKNGIIINTWSPGTSDVSINEIYSTSDGDYYYIKVKQADGDEAISSPVFIEGGISNTPPSCIVTNPENGTHYNSVQQITITADASDTDGSVSQVEFLVDGAPVGTDNTPPYSINWTIPANGAYSIIAKATDDQGAWTNSYPINITVGFYSDVITASIISGNDDAEEGETGNMYLNSTDLELVYDTFNNNFYQTVGLRFPGFGIPQGATITSAFIQFTTDEVSTGLTNLLITGEASDDSQGFSSTAFDLSSRLSTSSTINWTPADWTTIGASGIDQRTPDLSSIIQEIVDRPGFSQTSAISLLITGSDLNKRVAESFDKAEGTPASLSIEYTVGSDNNPPAFTSNPVVKSAATEDLLYTGFSIADDASDPDLGDVLTFSRVNGPTWLNVAPNGVLSGTPLNDDVGLNSWTVEVNDGNGGTDQATLEITVINTNDPPVFISNPILESNAIEDNSYSGTLTDNVFDPDPSDDLTFSKASYTGVGVDWLSIDANGYLSGIPTNENVGTGVWIVVVNDGNGGTDQAELQIEVVNTNDLPVFSSNPVVKSAATEDLLYTGFTIADDASDPDLGDVLTFSRVTGPTWLNVAPNGDLSGTPLNDDVGLNSWTVEVNDGNGGTDQATLEITVINTNDPPVFTSDPVVEIDANIDVGYASSIADDVTDPDVGDVLIFSKESGPAWLSVASNGALSGTPSDTDVGLNSWSVKVMDGSIDFDLATLEIMVIDISAVEYCVSTGVSTSEFIQEVQIGVVSNTSGNNGGYEDFTETIETLYIEESSTVNFTLTPGFNGRSTHQYWAIYIDYDNDGFFTIEDREFASSKSKSSVSGSFSPTGGTGLLRMRISMSDSGTPSGCGAIGGGEVEDYLVQIGAPVIIPPIADFSADQTTVVAGSSVNFTDLSANAPDSYSWSFPGGSPSTSTEANPSVIYNSVGDFDVSLTVTNSAGSDVEIKTGYITVTVPQDPVADFYASPTAIYEGESVQFTDISIYGPTTWSWNFGDGSPASSEQNPSHIYANAGTYSVTLSVSNSIGSDALTRTDYITVAVPPVSSYCEPTGIINSTWITSIDIGGTVNITGQNEAAYTFFTSPVFDLSGGSSYSISLVPNDPKSRNFWRIWIDANGDGDFIDTGETLFTGNNKKGTVNGNITIPSNTVASTRLRISMKTGSSQAPCDNGFTGEVEDYTVNNSIGDGKNGFIVGNTNNVPSSSFSVYPNPADEMITVDFEGWEGKKLIRLIDMTGRTLVTKTVYKQRIEIDISAYPKGIYLLDVNDGIIRGHKKLSIQ